MSTKTVSFSVGRGQHKSPFDNGVKQNILDFFGIQIGRYKPTVLDWTRQFTIPGENDSESESLMNDYQFV